MGLHSVCLWQCPLFVLLQFNDLTRFGGFFCVTFCIVAFQGFYMGNLDVVILAGSRVAAICIGVVFALVLACTIFPMSASGKVWACAKASSLPRLPTCCKGSPQMTLAFLNWKTPLPPIVPVKCWQAHNHCNTSSAQVGDCEMIHRCRLWR